MAIIDDIDRALRLRGAEARRNVTDSLRSAEKALADYGLALAVVSVGYTTIQISSAQLIITAIARAIASGEPEKGLQARIARLCGLSQSQIARALPTDERPEQRLGADARARLEEHLLDPAAHPLPAPLKERWKPGLEAIRVAGNGWPRRREKTSRRKGRGP